MSWWRNVSSSGAGGADLAPGQHLLDAAGVAALEPHLRDPPALAVHGPGDGAVDPVAVTEALAQGARDHGARVLLGTGAIAVRATSGRVAGLESSAGFLSAITVSLAAGVEVPVLCAPLGVEVTVGPSLALLLRLSAPTGLVKTLISSPDVEVREGHDGSLLAAVDYGREATRGELAQTAQRILAAITSTFRGADAIRLLVSARIGIRPMPADGEPIIGPVPGVPGAYTVVMHSA